jgi:NOL1/NOP2/fmu family ribosome biogenesis protein
VSDDRAGAGGDNVEQGDNRAGAGDKSREENYGQVFDRLPATADERVVAGRPTRREVLDWWDERFGVPPSTFDGHSFWEKGNGKIWAFAGDVPDGVDCEAVGITFLHARQEHWKPTTDAVQRFGRAADRNVIELSDGEAAAFAAGHDQDLPRWDGDWGYLIATHAVAGDNEPIGVALYVYGELRSRIPKGRREELD